MEYEEFAEEPEESGDGEGWIVTFSDLMSLLLTFFILLFSMSTIQKEKFKELAKSLQSALGVEQVPEAGTREGLEMLQSSQAPQPNAVDDLGSMVQKEMQDIKSEVQEFVLKNKLGGKVKVQIGQKGAVITISDVVLFPAGAADFTQASRRLLPKITALLKQFPYNIKVEGHTDNTPIHTREFPSNWELSTARAAKLVRFFIANGIPPERLSAEGFAQYRPIASNRTRAGRAANRRVEIVYTRESITAAMKKKLPQGSN